MQSRTDTKIAFKRYSFELDLRKIMRRSHIPMFYEVWFKWHKLHKEKKLYISGVSRAAHCWWWSRMDDSKLLNHVSKVWQLLFYNKRLVQHLYWTSFKVNAFELIQNVIMVNFSCDETKVLYNFHYLRLSLWCQLFWWMWKLWKWYLSVFREYKQAYFVGWFTILRFFSVEYL